MSYGLQIFNAQGNPIMDTDERFTRVYGSYNDRTIQGTRYYGSSRYCELTTFSQDVAVFLPPSIQKWAPIIVKTSHILTSSNYVLATGQTTGITGDAISYMISSDPYSGKANFTNLTQSIYNAVGYMAPCVIGEALTVNGNPIARIRYRYMAHLKGRGSGYEGTGYVERRLTYSFIVVGY